MGKPKKVIDAQRKGDTEALSRMGRAGNQEATRRRRERALFHDGLAVRREIDEEFRQQQAGELVGVGEDDFVKIHSD